MKKVLVQEKKCSLDLEFLPLSLIDHCNIIIGDKDRADLKCLSHYLD